MSEEDIRGKVVNEWLKDHGFSPDKISLEYSFNLQVGHNLYRLDGTTPKKSSIHARADVLVRDDDGQNLFIVEVKASTKQLTPKTCKQALSYARLLEDGIAPFTVITNGTETEIYDSVSGEIISNTSVPKSHPYVINGYKPSGDALSARANALETFITLSPENLLVFCKHQVAYRMSRLKGDDIDSVKKYIPQLYVQNKQAHEKLEQLRQDETHKVIFVSGKPQTGKTNFICATVEALLESGEACLFFPAIGLREGVLHAICEDFAWEFGESVPSHTVIHQRLSKIAKQTGKPIHIFIDGWNETSQQLADQIDKDCKRLAKKQIKLIISFTNLSAKRLLRDKTNNPLHLADETQFSTAKIQTLESDPYDVPSKMPLVPIGEYETSEIDEIYNLYEGAFKVLVSPEHQKVSNPFVLRIAMFHYRGRCLPDVLDEPKLIEAFINEKSERVRDFPTNTVADHLISLAKEYVKCDQAVTWRDMCSVWHRSMDAPPEALFDAALLAWSSHTRESTIDFYNERERDFIISCWVYRWQELNVDEDNLAEKWGTVSNSRTLSSALRWFLPNHPDLLKHSVKSLNIFKDSETRLRVVRSFCEFALASQGSMNWIQGSDLKPEDLLVLMEDDDVLVRIEAVKLCIELMGDDPYSLGEFIPVNKEIIWSFLSVNRDAPEYDELFDYTVVKALTELHHIIMAELEQPSEVTDILFQLLYDESMLIRVNAAKVLGNAVPMLFFEEIKVMRLKNQELSYKQLQLITNAGFEKAIESLSDTYYGPPLCSRGYLDVLEDRPEELYLEGKKLQSVFESIKPFATKTNLDRMSSLIKSFSLTEKQRQQVEHLIDDEFPLLTEVDYRALKYQLVLPHPYFDYLRLEWDEPA